MYDFYSKSRKLERIFKASNLKPLCHDPNHETPRISNIVQKWIDAAKALDSGEGADATPRPERHGRFSAAAVAILRTELAFHAVRRLQLCKWARFQPSAVLDSNMEGMLTGVAPSDCIEAICVLRALSKVALDVEHTRIPLLEQVRALVKYSSSPLPMSSPCMDTVVQYHIFEYQRSVSQMATCSWSKGMESFEHHAL